MLDSEEENIFFYSIYYWLKYFRQKIIYCGSPGTFAALNTDQLEGNTER